VYSARLVFGSDYYDIMKIYLVRQDDQWKPILEIFSTREKAIDYIERTHQDQLFIEEWDVREE
jgi:hypothetical protein